MSWHHHGIFIENGMRLADWLAVGSSCMKFTMTLIWTNKMKTKKNLYIPQC